jgi:branched-chain amino acid transport system permease protein
MDIFWQLFLQGVILSVEYALITTGFGIIFGTTGHFHIAHAGAFTLAGYVLFIFATLLNIPLFSALILAVIITALTGVFIYRGIYFQVIKRGGTMMTLFIAALGTLAVIENGFQAIFSATPMAVESKSMFKIINIFNGTMTLAQLIFVIVGIIVLLVLQIFMSKTRTGRLIRAVAVNPYLSQIVGISIKKIYMICYAIGSALVAIPACYITIDAGALSGRGLELVIISMMAVIMGGIGSLVGGWIAALFVGMFFNLSVLQVEPHWQSAVIFVIFLIMIMVRPTGLFGQRT